MQSRPERLRVVDRATLYRSLASSGATLVSFAGVFHETVGAKLFPWAPAVFGGQVGWYGAGVATILAGLLLLASTLGMVKLPVTVASLVVAGLGLAAAAFAALVHSQLHP